jgi:ABC-type Co2+ transport system permease subunit
MTGRIFEIFGITMLLIPIFFIVSVFGAFHFEQQWLLEPFLDAFYDWILGAYILLLICLLLNALNSIRKRIL